MSAGVDGLGKSANFDQTFIMAVGNNDAPSLVDLNRSAVGGMFG
jgi:hypothetical protein